MSVYVYERSRQIWIIVSASLAGFMVLLDGNIVNISLPVISGYFNVSTTRVVQITLVYLLMLTSTLIIFGKMADKYGVKRVFVTGFSVFTVSSLLCGIAPGFTWLLVARALQALGGAMLYSTSISMISRFIPPERRGWAYGIFSPLSSLGMLVGNPLGGLITGMLNWHWIFLVNIPVGILAVIAAIRAIPSDRPPRTGERSIGFDYLGSLLSLAGLSLMVILIGRGRVVGYTSPLILGGFGLVVILLVAFILWERKARDPVLDLTIFSGRSFSFAILASVAGFGLLSGNGVLLPFYLTYGLKINVEHAGFILMTFPVIFSLVSPVTGRLSDRVSKNRLTMSGMALAAVTCVGFALLLPEMHLAILYGYMVLIGIAYALFITPNNNLVMSMAAADKQSVSSGVFKLATNLGQMFGLIVMEILFTSSFSVKSSSDGSFGLDKVPVGELTGGFSAAFYGAAVMCVLAILFSLFIREKDTQVTTIEETAFLG